MMVIVVQGSYKKLSALLSSLIGCPTLGRGKQGSKMDMMMMVGRVPNSLKDPV